MATFVLVHGGWHGGWCWKKVVPLLRAAGHEVFTPTLTGLGERAHLLTPTIDLLTHVQDILAVLSYEDVSDVTLVGHSYDGMVIAGVAEVAAARLAHLVYLDAIVPTTGQAVFDLAPPEFRTALEDGARSGGDGWRIPPWSIQSLGVTAATDVAWAAPRLVPHPLKTLEQPLRLAASSAAALPCTFIHCTQGGGDWFAPFVARAQSAPGWRYRELAAGHDVMITAPQELSSLLLEAAH